MGCQLKASCWFWFCGWAMLGGRNETVLAFQKHFMLNVLSFFLHPLIGKSRFFDNHRTLESVVAKTTSQSEAKAPVVVLYEASRERRS